ncbi:2-oxo-4-hydroxy-4-carboxy-5-ureidoimidazoline decarboxylase [Curvivirga sp.]|uniref:2-oxo-4-hydroxy-4-carboxy-5-ureidoimidazoline decarboxylase n=1 Tax=Curvivirga sp. TaxID=2856848 RepID=UPI003B59CDE0
MSDSFKTLIPSDLNKDEFVSAFADIYEHSPWVAERSYDKGITKDHNKIEVMADLMSEIMLAADKELQLKLIIAHPDLAGRAAVRGELTESSTKEQAGAGLDECSPEEMEKFQTYNTAYKEKFGFPFIIAVTGLNRHIILDAFETRLKNTEEEEFQTALIQINKIATIRLNQL